MFDEDKLCERIEELEKNEGLLTCLLCQSFLIEVATPGYSEYTPGDDWGAYCWRGVWTLDPRKDNGEKYRKKMLTANHCKYFELSQTVKDIREKEKTRKNGI